MKITKTQQLWDDAHTLRGANRITFGAAVEKYGAATVRRAMRIGNVAVTWTEMLTPAQAGDTNASGTAPRPYKCTSFDFATGRPEMVMQANGEQVG